MKSLLRNHRRLALCFFDIICYIVVTLICFAGTFIDPSIQVFYPHFFTNSIILGVMIFTFRVVFGFYKNIWRYTYTKAYFGAIVQDACATVVSILLAFLTRGVINGNFEFKVWQFAVMSSLFCLVTLASRYVYRLRYKYRNRVTDEGDTHKINVAIVGAGQLGALLADELRYSKVSNYNPIAFIDKDKAKKGEFIAGLRVYHEDDNIVKVVKNLPIQEIIIAMPGLDSDAIKHLYELYSQTGCRIQLYDTPVTAIGGDGTKRMLRDFQVEDLLFRKPLKINSKKDLEFYNDKVVLITGGGGSIGSELCRQIANLKPKKLIIVDIYENNAYDIQQELRYLHKEGIDLEVHIASVRDAKRIDTIFEQYRPNIVFHAAAHKHVPLMENSPAEAIKNNVFGTYNVANAAEKYGAEKFILVSTDKAVNPTNVMGASKRMCEMIIQCRYDSKTSFSAVRFGNVLGSNGSVVPLFRMQMSYGGPITLTDKRIVRYFMTIPEASQLVLQAGAMAKRGELFVLDMGDPIKIYDLAVDMIKLSGLKPDVDIIIEETGLRPGEKLYEELLIKGENISKTENDMIFIEKDVPPSRAEVDEKLKKLGAAVEETSSEVRSERIFTVMKEAVPTFKDPEEVNRLAAESEEMKAAEARNEENK